MNPEGELTVRLDCAGGRVRRVGVRSSRTGLPPRLVHGRAADDVQRIVPMLFSVCGRAQGSAAAAAIAAARGVPPAESQLARMERAVLVESLQETAWRLLIDWPKAMGEAPLVPPVARIRQAAQAVGDDGASLDALLEAADDALAEHVYGCPAHVWLADTEATALDAWIATAPTLPARLLRRLRDEAPGLGSSAVTLMPDATLDALRRAVLGGFDDDAGYERQPQWDGRPVETGALARQAHVPLVAAVLARQGRTATARFIARLVELAALLAQLRAGAPGGQAAVRSHRLGPDLGLGAVETARGLLLHRVRLQAGGTVAEYRIVAPTEWNFHPDGALAQGLAGRAADDVDRLEREARTVVQSLDPCVACTVEIADA